MLRQQLPGICQVAHDFYSMPRRKGSIFFVKSPKTNDKTASLALYPATNRFCDFANGNYNGDIIGFVAYVRGCNNWQALKELQAFYGLSDSREQDKQGARRRIQLQQENERKKRERFREFYSALQTEIDNLKKWQQACQKALDEGIYEPLSEMHGYLIDQLQLVDYKLSVLCATDCEAYRRMKVNAEKGLPSDAFQWLLDCIEILKRDGLFTATQTELKEIQTQAAFELMREPNKDRVCEIDWSDHIWRGGGDGNKW